MLVAKIQFAPWDKFYNFSLGGLDIAPGNYIIVETELGTELGKVISISSLPESLVNGKDEEREIKPIIRKADYDDIAKLPSAEKKEEVMKSCQDIIIRQGLSMKLVDVNFSFEGNRMNFAFIADGRVDFRELVKELAAQFNVNIRLTQIGTRDEAKITGDCGPCGKGLCCRGVLKEFSSITSEMAEAQQVVNRGSERISGMCGRLMCCLAYEYEGYKDLASKLPPIGAKVNADGIRGTVVGHHILKQVVDVRVAAEKDGERDMIIPVDINRKKK